MQLQIEMAIDKPLKEEKRRVHGSRLSMQSDVDKLKSFQAQLISITYKTDIH